MIFRFLTRKSWKKPKYFLPQDTVRLSCTSSSSRPPATLSWILNDQKVINCKLIPKSDDNDDIASYQTSSLLMDIALSITFWTPANFPLCTIMIVQRSPVYEPKKTFLRFDTNFRFPPPHFAGWKVILWKFSFLCFAMFIELKGLFWDLTPTFIFVSN